MLKDKKILEILNKQDELKKENAFAEEIAEDMFPYLDEITKQEIKDSSKLKIKLKALFDKKIKKKYQKYQDIIFAIFQISIPNSSSGFLILNSKKFLNLLIKRKISELTTSIIGLAKKTPTFILNPLCSLVNSINNKKFNAPNKVIKTLVTEKISYETQIFK